MEKFLQEKYACGYAYREATRILRRLDDFLVQEGLATCELPGLSPEMLAKKAHESDKPKGTHTLVRHSPGFCCGLAIPRMCPISH